MSNAKKLGSVTTESETTENHTEQTTSKDTRPVCGLIMPIADTEGYPIGHWKEVKKIITDVAEAAGFRTRLVSESEDVRVIQKNIVQNVFDDDIIICDVSSKNPNVMFELGLRFAFDKATVIIKDDVTGYSFDTSPVEHINYPKDLRYSLIENFKKDLAAKLTATYSKSKEPGHSMYLQNFGKFVIKELHTEVVSNDEYVIETLKEIKSELRDIKIKSSSPITDKRYRVSSPSSGHDYRNAFLSVLYDTYLTAKNIDKIDSLTEFRHFVENEFITSGYGLPSLSSIEKFVSTQEN
ncbi:MAG: hypothetical protein ACK4E6_02830 [Chryseobacterium hispalense]